MEDGLLLERNLLGFKRTVRILNIYGPYHHREEFWDKVMESGILNDPSLIVVGDLNFTLSASKVWGNGNHYDPLADYFRVALENAHTPSVLVPSWSNGRVGKVGLDKRLDRFIIDEDLSSSVGRYKSWSLAVGLSHHKPVILQLYFEDKKVV